MLLIKTLITIVFLCAFSLSEVIIDSGYLRDSQGKPVSKTAAMQYRLYDSASNGKLLWQSAVMSIPVQNGLYTVTIDEQAADFPINHFLDQTGLFWEQVIDGETMLPRKPQQRTISTILAMQAEKLATMSVAQFTNDSGYLTSKDAAILIQNSVTQTQGRSSIILIQKDYNVGLNDEVILADASNSAIGVTMPDATSQTGKQLTVKKTDSSVHPVDIKAEINQLIDGHANYRLSAGLEYAIFISDGKNWLVIGNN